jgi:hypothetical protein
MSGIRRVTEEETGPLSQRGETLARGRYSLRGEEVPSPSTTVSSPSSTTRRCVKESLRHWLGEELRRSLEEGRKKHPHGSEPHRIVESSAPARRRYEKPELRELSETEGRAAMLPPPPNLDLSSPFLDEDLRGTKR